MAQRQNKLLKAALAVAMGLLVGCIAEDDEGAPESVTSSTALAVLSQGLDGDEEIQDNGVQAPVCQTLNADPDGDGWGWEDQRSCRVESSENSVARSDAEELPVGIVYYLWHCATKGNALSKRYSDMGLARGEEFNITHVLNGEQEDWGNKGNFHWWDKPAEGYYCLGNRPDVIDRHLEMLRDAGIDYLVLDMTNHPNTVGVGAEDLILKSLNPLLEAVSNMPDAPRLVPWVPFVGDTDGTKNELAKACESGNSKKCRKMQGAVPMYQHVSNLIQNQYPEVAYQYQGKPMILEAANERKFPREETAIVRSQLEASWTVRPMWGLRKTNDEWQFLTTCNNPVEFYESRGWSTNGCNQPVNAGEQISVTAAYQYTYISEDFTVDPKSYAGFTGGMPKFHGRTMAQQFRVAFENRDSQPMVLLTGWNEWIAQRLELDGKIAFVDAFDSDRNRDIEPGGASGDLYYYLMKDLITQYRNNKPFAFEDYFLTEISIFDANYYYQTYEDLQRVFAADDYNGLLNHWLTVGKYENRSPSVAFDAPYYRDRYPALAQAGITTSDALLQHFIDYGFQEGRQASVEFHAETYLDRYSEVEKMFGQNGFYKAFKYFTDVGQHAPSNHDASRR